MKFNITFKKYSLLFLGLFLFVGSSWGFEDRFYLAAETYNTSEEGEVTRYSLITETTRYFFRPPYQWKLSTDVEEKTVLFLAPNQSAAVKMRIGSNLSCDNLDNLKNEIKSRFSNGEITGESTVYTAGGAAAPCFDIQWRNELKIYITTRLVLVPTKDGTVEFSLSTGSDRFEANSNAINNLACSFRTEPSHLKVYAKE